MKIFSPRRRLVAALLVILALVLFHPAASRRLKSRIVLSMSSALGRSVDIGSVHLSFFPRPGFDLNNLIVYDDPAFGAEPMLRADQVTATLRLTSLLRGRIEIARLDLNEPSLNLVHGLNGRWNLEALLERTARTPLAPTAKSKREPRPAFPYIEASSARINFKNGPEKKPYALTNADFSLWQDSEDTWGVRLKAQPLRTDLNLNDMGLLRVDGTWQRSATLSETPVQFNLQWNRSQLGQLSKFFSGNDQGWRGGVQIEATLTGTPAHLQIATDASIEDFRRYDITSGQALRLAAHCDGQYSSVEHAFQAVVCKAPVQEGIVTLRASAALPTRSYRAEIAASSLPMRPLLALAQRAKKSLAEDLSVSGVLQGSILLQKDISSPLRVEGRGEIDDFRLASVLNRTEIGPQTIPLVWTTGGASKGSSKKLTPAPLRKISAGRNLQALHAPEDPHLEFGPISLGPQNTACSARGWITSTGYSISLTGDAEIAGTLRLAHTLGIPQLQAAPEGNAQLDLQIAGSWRGWGSGESSGFSGPQVIGDVRLHGVRIVVRGAGGPIEVAAADMKFSQDAVRVEKLRAEVAGETWSGSLEMPRGCGTPAACQVRFNLIANEIALKELRAWASPPPAEKPWYRVLGAASAPAPSFFASVRATGRITTDHLQLRVFAASHASANVTLNRGKLEIADLNADFLGSKHRGTWHADFSVAPATCEGSGNLAGVSLSRLTAATSAATSDGADPASGSVDSTKHGWISGAAAATYQVKGTCGQDFWQSAEGTLQFDVTEGAISRIALAENIGSLKIVHLKGQARLRDGRVETSDAQLDSPSGKFLVSGAISLPRDLDLKLARVPPGAVSGYSITGTLADPRVAPLPGSEQARLKTDPAK
jgi:hypothetical protein